MRCLVLLIGLLSFSAIGQQENVWKNLSDVTYEIGEDDFGELYLPVFGDKIKEMEGKEITADGYIIPFEGMFKPEHIILSSLPLAECFFCGSGGPETVMEVMLKEPVKYTSKKVKVTGNLVLNAKDPEKLMYILKEARIIDP
ncbi:hypothetical protein [Cyclobacterium amurskyense]|uniref:DUF3299 domain-containing protein n=1 Tax=Cyclobacterium amurskyense TaxID=320787 RepID=A0A0H4P8Q0_9BACT|nr:hypothetical protein [Cyclobacterium amurskyense]AKP49495.1 hypothetical protein CA2015_0007 [Cyclobacterium amurskyense]|tara:strand:+ start:23329 stop:23754 length:426 start_codon:yes stop_codon:yes gene_type:complete